MTGLARCIQKDIDATWEAIKVAQQPHIHIFLATSPIHMEYKLKIPEQVVEQAVEAVKYAKSSSHLYNGLLRMHSALIVNFSAHYERSGCCWCNND